MSVGAVPATGLAGLDVNAAAANLGNVGLPPGALPVEPLQGPPVPVEARPVEGPPAPAGVDTSQVVQPAAPVGPSGEVPIPTTPPEAIKDFAASSLDEVKARKLQTEAEQKANEAKAIEDQKAADQIRERQRQADIDHQADEQTRARMTDIAKKADDAVENFKFTDYKDTISSNRKIGLVLGAALSGLSGDRNPMATIDGLIDAHFQQQKADLAKAEHLSQMRREGVKDFDQHLNDKRLYLDFQERNYREALAKEADAMAARSNNPVVQAKGQQLAAELRAKADEKVVDLSAKWAAAETARERAKLLEHKAKAAGGGGGHSDALAQFAAAAQALKPGEPIGADLIKLGGRAGFKPKDIAGQVKQFRESGVKSTEEAAKAAEQGAKAEKAATGFDPALVVRVSGKDIGLASSPRVVKPIEDRFANYIDAIKALKELRASGNFAPSGDIYKRAALAVAATTTANASDHTTAMEAGTLANSLGIVNNESIDRQLKHTVERFDEFKSQLRPLPANKGGGEQAPPGAIIGKDASGKRGYVLNGKFTAF